MPLLEVVPPSPFDLVTVAKSHGWFDLAPFEFSEAKRKLSVSANLGSEVVHVCIYQSRADDVLIVKHTTGQCQAAARLASTCLQLDEDLSELFGRFQKNERFRWACSTGAGRFLRAPSVFEDAVKILCTTNCSWATTKSMVSLLVEEYGAKDAAGHKAFPTPAELEGVSERDFKHHCRMGYRAHYLRLLVRDVLSGDIDLESLRTHHDSEMAVWETLKKLKGFGPYSIGLMKRLTRCYGDFALDSWCRAQYQKMHPRVKNIERHAATKYGDWGRYAGLVFWLDITRHWHLPDAKWP